MKLGHQTKSLYLFGGLGRGGSLSPRSDIDLCLIVKPLPIDQECLLLNELQKIYANVFPSKVTRSWLRHIGIFYPEEFRLAMYAPYQFLSNYNARLLSGEDSMKSLLIDHREVMFDCTRHLASVLARGTDVLGFDLAQTCFYLKAALFVFHEKRVMTREALIQDSLQLYPRFARYFANLQRIERCRELESIMNQRELIYDNHLFFQNLYREFKAKFDYKHFTSIWINKLPFPSRFEKPNPLIWLREEESLRSLPRIVRELASSGDSHIRSLFLLANDLYVVLKDYAPERATKGIVDEILKNKPIFPPTLKHSYVLTVSQLYDFFTSSPMDLHAFRSIGWILHGEDLIKSFQYNDFKFHFKEELRRRVYPLCLSQIRSAYVRSRPNDMDGWKETLPASLGLFRHVLQQCLILKENVLAWTPEAIMQEGINRLGEIDVYSMKKMHVLARRRDSICPMESKWLGKNMLQKNKEYGDFFLKCVDTTRYLV